MRSVRDFLAIPATILLLVVLVPSALASTPHTLTIGKECSQFTGKIPSFCTITSSNVTAIPVASKVWYYGPVVGSSVFLSSTAIINDGKGNTATGYCQVDNHTGVGLCMFWKGTGKLTGFHALIHGSGTFADYHWDGTYYFSGR